MNKTELVADYMNYFTKINYWNEKRIKIVGKIGKAIQLYLAKRKLKKMFFNHLAINGFKMYNRSSLDLVVQAAMLSSVFDSITKIGQHHKLLDEKILTAYLVTDKSSYIQTVFDDQRKEISEISLYLNLGDNNKLDFTVTPGLRAEVKLDLPEVDTNVDFYIYDGVIDQKSKYHVLMNSVEEVIRNTLYNSISHSYESAIDIIERGEQIVSRHGTAE